MTTTTYRKARIDDALELSKLAESTFRATFGAVNTAEHMELHCRENYSQDIQASEISNSQVLTLVGENDGHLIGYAQMRWGKVPECVAAQRPAELNRLYVAQQWHGKGIAQVLMNACIEAALEHGSDAVWLGVWERNPKAISFYRKLGFTEVGDHTFPLGGDPQRDIVMVRPLNSGWPNYAFKPIAEQALRSNQTIVPQRLNAALGFCSSPAALASVVVAL